MRPRNTARNSDRGFALLIVLWSLVLLALLGSQLAAAGRGETRLAANLRAGAVAEAAADGAIHEALFHLLDSSNRHWPADGTPRQIRVPGAIVELRVTTEAGKVNPNTAQPELLRALLHAVGADERTAAAVAVAIADWRFPDAQDHPLQAKAPQYRAAGRDYGPPSEPFQTIDELGLVLGMFPALLARLAPHLSIYHDGDPDPAAADPVVRQAIQDATGVAPQAGGGPRDESVVAITATARGANGTRFVRRAIAGIGGHTQERPYRILSWESE